MADDVCDQQHKGRDLLSYPEAVGRLLFRARPLGRPPEEMPLRDCRGRTLAAAVAQDRDEPPVRRSAMDGFAVRCADGDQLRKLGGTVFAGTAESPRLGPGEAVAVMTGGTVAPGADAVVPVERTNLEKDEQGADRVRLHELPMAGQHIRSAGEQGRQGRVLLDVGRRLNLQDLIAAAACGADPLSVNVRPTVAILSTGDEVIPWTEKPAVHQVRDSNRLGAEFQLQRAGAQVLLSRHLADEPAVLKAALGEAMERADVVVTIGGVSMGQKDYLPGVFDSLGVEEMFHGVSVQPGKPVWAGIKDQNFVLGLPGNPISTFVILELFATPLMQRLSGGSPLVPRPLQVGQAGGPAGTRKRERFFPADLSVADDGSTIVTRRPETGSGDWTSLSGADALLHLPAHGAVEAGDPVGYLRLD